MTNKTYVLELSNAPCSARTIMIAGRTKEPAYEMIEHWIKTVLDGVDEETKNLRVYFGEHLSKKDFGDEVQLFMKAVREAEDEPSAWLKAAASWCKMTAHVVVLHELEFPE